jgi:hypothetical protein
MKRRIVSRHEDGARTASERRDLEAIIVEERGNRCVVKLVVVSTVKPWI